MQRGKRFDVPLKRWNHAPKVDTDWSDFTQLYAKTNAEILEGNLKLLMWGIITTPLFSLTESTLSSQEQSELHLASIVRSLKLVMLRVLKQKAMVASSDETQCRGQSPVTSIIRTTGETNQVEHTPIVSHVPISICTRTESSSAESTISSNSDEEECCRESSAIVTVTPEEKNDLQEREKGRDSQDESSKIDSSRYSEPSRSSLGTTLVPSYSSPKLLARSRCISIEDQDSFLPITSKRPRLLSHCSDDTVQLRSKIQPHAPIKLLACEDDEAVLSPLHAFIRKQIEVFTATSIELRQPAPGRKQPIKLHQVGLRCIHCKNNPSGRRVKRAVCYPTNVGRIYHSVSDMKFDHFSNCVDLPAGIRAQFENLKADGNKRIIDQKTGKKGAASSTAQYYHDSAVKMGMFDGPQGIFISGFFPWNAHEDAVQSLVPKPGSFDPNFFLFQRSFPIALLNSSLLSSAPTMSTSAHSLSNYVNTKNNAIDFPPTSSAVPNAPKKSESRQTLDEDSDGDNLNQIHCFVRKHIEFFAASKNDIAAPAPGRKTRVVLGQVGIRCIHCIALPPRHRVKRAICYPPSVSGIYHAVSNMKFDHFASCRGLPSPARQEFRALKEACCRKGSGGNSAGSKGNTSSTKKYYEDSAIRKGLMDSETGIRFVTCTMVEKDIDSPSNKVAMPCGLSALVKAACQAA